MTLLISKMTAAGIMRTAWMSTAAGSSESVVRNNREDRTVSNLRPPATGAGTRN
jgi:hypothetical protein